MWRLIICDCIECDYSADDGNFTMNQSDLHVSTSHWMNSLFEKERQRSAFFCSYCCGDWPVRSASALAASAALVLIACLLYYYLILPMNLQRDLCDVGFDYLTDGHYKSSKYKKRNKRELVHEVQRRRKIGDLPPVYPNGWFVLMESDDLSRGQARHVAALGENFAVFRGEDGRISVLDAYCPHLGANMAVGGTVRGNCIECPFHSWRFDGTTGDCVGVPYAEKLPDFVKVKKWHSIEVNSLVFVWYHAENSEPTWFPEKIAAIEDEGWMYQGRSEFYVGCHIQEIPENGADVAHLNAIHKPSVLAGPDLRFYDKLGLRFMKHMWTADWRPSTKETHKGILSLTFDTRLFDKLSIANMAVRVEQIGPGYVTLEMDTSWGPMLLLQMVTPVEPLLQKVVHRMYSPWQQMLFAKFTLYAELIMFSRDVMVWNHKKYLKKAQIIKEDKAIQKHRRWYSQFYSEHSPVFTYQKESVLW